MIVLTFPSIAKGETVIRAQGDGIDDTVGYCCRIGGLGWTAVLYGWPGNVPKVKVAEFERLTLAALRDAVNGRLERSGKWWR